MFAQPGLRMQFLSRETQGWVGEGGRAGPGCWKERTTETCLLGEECSLPKGVTPRTSRDRHTENGKVCSGKMEDSEDKTHPCNWGKNTNYDEYK